MTGPEHYLAGERCLAESYEIVRPHDEGHCEADRSIAEATAHFLAAQVALAVMSQPISGMPDEPGLDQEEFDDWYAAVNGLPEDNSKTRLQRAVAALLHDADTSADDQLPQVLGRFREGLPDTAHGEPVLALAAQLMDDLEYDPTSATEARELDQADEFALDAAADADGGDPR